MADMLNFDPKFYNSLDALNRGSQDVNVLAQQRAAALLAKIKADRENEIIDSDIAHKKAMADSYRAQVEAQLAKTQMEKPYDVARANDLKRQAAYAPLNAIYEQMQSDIPSAAQSYNQLKEKGLLPDDVLALEGPEATFSNPGQPEVRSRFNPGVMKGLLEGFGRPKAVTDIQKTGMQQTGATERNTATNQTQIEIAKIRADATRALAAVKQGQIPKENFENWVTSKMRSGELDPTEGINLVMQARQAAAQAAASQTAPTIDLGQYGVPTTNPAIERQKMGGGSPTQQPKRKPLSSFEQ